MKKFLILILFLSSNVFARQDVESQYSIESIYFNFNNPDNKMILTDLDCEGFAWLTYALYSDGTCEVLNNMQWPLNPVSTNKYPVWFDNKWYGAEPYGDNDSLSDLYNALYFSKMGIISNMTELYIRELLRCAFIILGVFVALFFLLPFKR